MKPTASEVHIDEALSDLSLGPSEGQVYVADTVFPVCPVGKSHNTFFKYNDADFFRDSMEKRAPGAAPSRAEMSLSTDTYDCEEWSEAVELPDEEVDEEDDVLDQRESKTFLLKEHAKIQRERYFATNFFKAGVWNDDAAVDAADRWDDYGASAPIKDIRDRAESMRSATGRPVTHGVLGHVAWRHLAIHPDLRDAIKYVGKPVADLEDLAKLTGIPNWVIGSAVYTSSGEGETDVLADIWGKSLLLLHVAPRVSRNCKTAGITFAKRTMWDMIRTWRDEEAETEVLQIKTKYHQKVVAAPLGRFLGTVVN